MLPFVRSYSAKCLATEKGRQWLSIKRRWAERT